MYHSAYSLRHRSPPPAVRAKLFAALSAARARAQTRPSTWSAACRFFVKWFVHYDGVQGNKQRGIEQLKLAAYNGRYYGPFAKILLAVVSLREKKAAEAEKILSDLAQEFPENELFKQELVRVSRLVKKRRQ
jgi:hypothetical protein